MADPKSNAFMLSSATLMMAPAFATDVFSLTPAAHSVGMARDVTVMVDSSLTELKNGIAQSSIDARRTNIQAQISATVFEYSAQNLSRALAISGATTQIRRGVLAASITSSSTTLSITSDPVPGDSSSALTVAGDIPSGATLLIQRVNGETDYVFPTQSTGTSTVSTGTFTTPISGNYVLPTGMTFPAGARVWVVTQMKVAGTEQDDLFGVKITGSLSNYDRPVTCVFPKVRITKGFSIAYSEGDYGSMPWEMQPFLLTGSEITGRLTDIGAKSPGLIYAG